MSEIDNRISKIRKVFKTKKFRELEKAFPKELQDWVDARYCEAGIAMDLLYKILEIAYG